MKESDAQRKWEFENDPARIDQDDEREVHETDYEAIIDRRRNEQWG
jgi:hypothetical protein